MSIRPAENECIELMRDARLIFLRNVANRWHLYEDLNQPNKFRMEVVVPSWKQHLLQPEGKRSSPEASQSSDRSKSSRRMDLTFCGEGSSQQKSENRRTATRLHRSISQKSVSSVRCTGSNFEPCAAEDAALPSDVLPFSYSQPDRLNPSHSPLHTEAIMPRTSQ